MSSLPFGWSKLFCSYSNCDRISSVVIIGRIENVSECVDWSQLSKDLNKLPLIDVKNAIPFRKIANFFSSSKKKIGLDEEEKALKSEMK